jgi:hypothetical protein
MAPTVSSVYSQPSGYEQYESQTMSQAYEAARQNGSSQASYYNDDISPPDSPIRTPTQAHRSGDVSPVDLTEADIHPAFRTSSTNLTASNIPVRRKPSPMENANAAAPSRAYQRDPSAPLRWDKYSGEPTTNKSRGLPSTVKPENVIQQVKLRSVSGKKKSEEPASPTTTLPVDTRPPWKGGSGRSAVVEPVQDRPGQKLPVPKREGASMPGRKPVGSGLSSPISLRSPVSPVGLGVEDSTSTLRLDTDLEQEDVEEVEEEEETYEEPATPVMSAQRFSESESRPGTAQTTTTMDKRQSYSVKPIDSTPKSEASRDTPNPNSRFSWTTQATNTTYNKQSPPQTPSDMPPLPTAPHPDAASYNFQPGGVMTRSRPVPSSKNYNTYQDSMENSPVSTPTEPTGRKIVSGFLAAGAIGNSLHPPPSPYHSRAGSNLSRTPSITSPIGSGPSRGPDKALPPTPQELQSRGDHVSELQARLDDLMTQRRNVERVLKDLTRPEALNPLNTNFKIEREREKRVAALRDELNEIGMQEHDIGLKLHRAQRRAERDEGYEGFTTLWVRRVTS